jgi:hypothetical protein
MGIALCRVWRSSGRGCNMALHVARGLFRLWLVLSALWIGGVGFVTWRPAREEEISVADWILGYGRRAFPAGRLRVARHHSARLLKNLFPTVRYVTPRVAADRPIIPALGATLIGCALRVPPLEPRCEAGFFFSDAAFPCTLARLVPLSSALGDGAGPSRSRLLDVAQPPP